jgi:hypothetical protein
MANGKTYMWRVRAIQGADTTEWSETWSFTIEPIQGIEDQLNENRMSLYPNPSSGNVYLEYNATEDAEIEVMITDLSGQALIRKELYFNKGKSSHALDLSTLPNGVYILRYINGDKTFARKITLNK